MINYLRLLGVLFFSIIILPGHTPATGKQQIVEGVLISGKSGKPVNYAHVYIVHGEEEALTNAKGEFKISTSQPFPLTLTIDHKDFQQTKLTVANNSGKLSIKLKTN